MLLEVLLETVQNTIISTREPQLVRKVQTETDQSKNIN